MCPQGSSPASSDCAAKRQYPYNPPWPLSATDNYNSRVARCELPAFNHTKNERDEISPQDMANMMAMATQAFATYPPRITTALNTHPRLGCLTQGIAMKRYEVIVGNIGSVLQTNNPIEARKAYGEYKRLSQANAGRAGGEDVVLLREGDIELEYTGQGRR